MIKKNMEKRLFLKTGLSLLVLFLFLCFNAYAGIEKKAPLSVRAVLFKSQQLSAQKKYRESLDLLKKYRATNKKGKKAKYGNHFLIDFTMGNNYLVLGNYKKAVPCYELCVKKYDKYAPAWMNLAKCRYELNMYEKAGECFLKGYINSDPVNPEALYYVGASFCMANKNQKAVLFFERLLKDHQDEVKLLWKEGLVQAYFACKLYKKALPHIKELAYNMKGARQKKWQEILLYQYLSLSMKQKALKYACYLTKNYSEEPKWWKGLAHVQLSNNKFDKALSALTVYSYLKSLLPSERQLLGDLNYSESIPRESLKYYKSILKEKKDLNIIKKIVYCCQRMNNENEALEWIDYGLGIKKEGKLLMIKGQILYNKKKFKQAASSFYQASQNLKNPGQAYLMQGFCLWYDEKINRAIEVFKTAKKYKTQKKSAVNALKMLNLTGC